MNELEEKTLTKHYVYTGPIVNLREDTAEMPDHSVADRILVEHPGGVGIALEDENGKFFFVSQWRYAQSEVTLEYPAGKREKGEDDLTVAKREIAEETGYEGTDWVYLGTIYPTPAYDSETIGMYYAKKGKYVGQHLDQDEFLDVIRLPIDKVYQRVDRGEIYDAKTLAALAMARKKLEMRN